jgi:putative transposase
MNGIVRFKGGQPRGTEILVRAGGNAVIAAWRQDYNHLRPHGSLGALTPTEFAMLKRLEEQSPEEGH